MTPNSQITRPIYWMAILLCCGLQLQAVILYSGENDANLTAPDTARNEIFNSVGRVCNESGGGARGSVVHIRGKYLLTANHVNVNLNYVTFDGTTVWQRDLAFTPKQIDGADMKLIKLLEDPGLTETPLYDDILGDTLVTGTLIGWGVGRDTSVADSGTGLTNIWQWGNSNTMEKRWGTNLIQEASTGTIAGYTYDYLATYLDRNLGSNEAAATLYDSGSGLFTLDSGVWKLVGLTTAITSINGPTEAEPNLPQNSTFGSGNALTSDRNFFVRISSYASSIEAQIPDLTTFAGWTIDHSLYGSDAEETADTDSDGINQLQEFAFGGDPNANDITILPTLALVEDSVNTYLELSVTRPKDLQGITYIPKTTTDLNNWPMDSNGIEDAAPTPIDNGDGTETVVYRRSVPVAGNNHAFMRIDVSQ